jgi:hypothetical protein
MSKLLSLKMWKEYTPAEWVCIKLSVAFFWLATVSSVTISHNGIPYPTGIFTFFNGSFLASIYTARAFEVCAFVLAILYVLEKWMTATTLMMFLVSLVLFTLEESSGFLNRDYLYTAIFFAQFIAYYRNKPWLNEERVQFAVQVIAGGYVLAGISKLNHSGLGWVTDAPLVSIQILKGYCFSYFNTGDIKNYALGMKHANFILQHKYLAESLFAGSLILELFAWIAVKNKATAFVYGILLTAMHMGIRHFMNILIGAIFYPMIIFMVNPVYLIYLLVKKLLSFIKPDATVEKALVEKLY